MVVQDPSLKKRALTTKCVKIIRILRKVTKDLPKPMVSSIIDEYGKDAFLILISCILSLRARDTVTLPICRKLFSIARTPSQILKIPLKKLENIIYSIGFYKVKAKLLHSISKELIERFNGIVPSNEHDLLSIKGVGRKTANLVLSQAYDIPAICVDVHVHRISNRMGLVKTKTPLETEIALQKILPKKYWSEWNRLLVILGQNIRSKQAISDFYNKINKELT